MAEICRFKILLKVNNMKDTACYTNTNKTREKLGTKL